MNARAQDNSSALMYAAHHKMVECLKILVKAGADPNGYTVGGMNSLMMAGSNIECLLAEFHKF